MIEYFVARHPIYRTANQELFAYEMLCRSSMSNVCTAKNGLEATCQVILHTFTELGIEKLAGQHPVFIKTPREFLLGGYYQSCPSQRTYLELVAGEPMDAELVSAIRRISGEGYRIALSGLPDGPEAWGLLECVSHVKLDVQRLKEAGLRKEVERAGGYRPKLCADKVETQAEFARVKELQIPYLQGFFFCRPRVHGATQVAPNRAALMELLVQFNDPRVSTDKLARNISRDVVLTHKLLRTLSSAIYSLPKIDSIHQALVLLGTERVKVWATMIMLAGLTDKPSGLLLTGLLRARLCERLAPALKLGARADTFFFVGLFSVLDALMDVPMSFVVENLPLAKDVVLALLNHSGPLGTALSWVLAHERGEFHKLGDVPLKPEEFRQIYLEGVSWADSTMRHLQEQK